MRKQLILLSLLLCVAIPISAQVSLQIRTSNVNIGINVPQLPRLVRVPSYPVYYAPELNSNYFFYDGEYWIYQDDNWYASDWYDGPWDLIEPEFVPLFILRVPVRYYRHPPAYFRGWRPDAPPRWNDHWGNNWAQKRSGWDQWNRRSAPPPAPLPTYQRRYSGDRYPRQTEQRHALRTQNYKYQPRDEVVRQHFQLSQHAQLAPQPTEQRPRQREEARDPYRDDKGRSRDRDEQQQKKQEQKRNEDREHGKGDERGPDRN